MRSLFSLSALRACDSFLQSSSPVQEWASNMRCLEQKWPAQKLQSPTIRWAASLHSLKLQRGLRGAIVVGVVGGGGVGLERGVDIEVLLRKRGGEIGSRSRFEGETLRRGFEISAVQCGGGEGENPVVEESCKKGRKGKKASTTSLYIG